MLVLLMQTALACDPSDLVKAIEAGEAAFGQNDPRAMAAANKSARRAMRCTDPTPEQDARLHRMIAYEAGLAKDWPKAEEAWRSSLASFPLLEPQKALFDNPRLHLSWIRAQEAPIRYSIAGSQHLAGLTAPLVPDTKPLGGSTRARKRGLRYAGIGVGVLAAGLYAGAWGSRANYDRLTKDGLSADQRKGSFRTTNALSIASVGATVLGGTMLVVSFTK